MLEDVVARCDHLESRGGFNNICSENLFFSIIYTKFAA